MKRISLGNTVFEGANNAYLHHGAATVLLDTGVAVPDTREELEAGLADHGVTFEEIDAIVLTHYHADHSGLAGEIQRASGATVHAHAADAPLIAGEDDAWADLEARHRELFEAWGMPTEEREGLLAFLTAADEAGIYGDPVGVTPFEDGELLAFGDLVLEVHHAPGHTAGLCCFVPAGENEVYTGDALLPEYTPNVGGADVRLEHPLEAYLETLAWLEEAGFDRAWPGHRDPIDDPAARARTIADHHEERAYRVLASLAEDGPADAWTVSARLFGRLEEIHVLHGPGEAFAHLEHLREEGDVTVADGVYRVTEDAATRLADRDGGRWPLR